MAMVPSQRCMHRNQCTLQQHTCLTMSARARRTMFRMELRELAREDASGISCAKAKRLIGWEPKRSWRDYLDEQGHAKPSEAEPKI